MNFIFPMSRFMLQGESYCIIKYHFHILLDFEPTLKLLLKKLSICSLLMTLLLMLLHNLRSQMHISSRNPWEWMTRLLTDREK